MPVSESSRQRSRQGSQQDSRVEISIAGPQSDAELRALMTHVPVGRGIVVTLEREPSFFEACRVHGEVQVCVGRDRETSRAVGMGTRAMSRAYVNGDETTLGYLADLRLLPEYRNGLLVARAYRFLRELHKDDRARLYTTVIFADNELALRTIASGRAGLPRYHDLGVMHYPGINLTRRKPEVHGDFRITPGNELLLPAILASVNRNGARRQFAPVHTVGDFRPGGRWVGLKAENFLVAARNGEVVAALAIWDQRPFKQTRILRYDGLYRWAAPCSAALHGLLGTPRFPRPGEVVPYCYFSFLSVDDDDLQVCRALLRAAYNEGVRAGYLYAMISAHERDPLLGVIREYRSTPFAGRLFCVTYEDGEEEFRKLDARVPSAEAATL
jgi:hypothetical protein